MIEQIPDRLERTLRQTLAPGERVFIKLKGAFQESLVCTDTRVLILKGGWMTGQIFGTDTFQLPYSMVAGAEVNFHLLTGYFELSTGGMQGTPKSQSRPFALADFLASPGAKNVALATGNSGVNSSNATIVTPVGSSQLALRKVNNAAT
jgi:hypothetical protein